jgi:phosphomannomutase
MDESLTQRALHWLSQDPDEQTKAQMRRWLEDENESAIARAFSGSLTFGTAGLRAELGPGSTGMNRVNVRKATAGLCRYLLAHSPAPTLVVGFDARHKSDVFAQDVVDVARGWGVHVVAVNEPAPTPVLAYFTRAWSAHAGVMITASHNPKSYNGYKVFAKNGAQIIAPADAEIVAAIEDESPLPATARGSYRCVSDTEIARFEAEIASLATPKGPLSIAYTALHGVGAKTTKSVFAKAGFALHCVEEQCAPDGDFPTVRFPNPEEDGALDLLQKKMIEVNADIGLAQDPDADRLGVVVVHRGQCRRLTGNEIGLLLGHHLLTTRARSHPMTVTTVVSSPLFSEMSRKLGARTERTLTGFKNIWNRALLGESEGDEFVFGYEEAIGFSVSRLIRDKDGIGAALVISELASQLQSEQRTLIDRLHEIYREFGHAHEHSFSVPVSGGLTSDLRAHAPSAIGGYRVLDVRDYSVETDASLRTDLIEYHLAGGVSILVRPSGTEPKTKIYMHQISAQSESLLPAIAADFRAMIVGRRSDQ